MEVYCLGEDIGCPVGDNYVWLVYDYETGDYCGYGEAVALDKDGNIHIWNLGHCSCYGPFEESAEVVSKERYLGGNALVCGTYGNVYDKAKELLEL